MPAHGACISAGRIAVFIALAATLLVLASSHGAARASEPETRERSVSLAGTVAGFPEGSRDRLFVEASEGCRLAAREGFSVAFEDGSRLSEEDGIRFVSRDGAYSISKDGGGDLGLDTRSPDVEISGSEGFFCRETRRDVVARAASEDRDGSTESGQSLGRAGPLAGTATINRDAEGEVESVEIPARCESGEAVRVSEGAAITLEETGENAERFRFVNGAGNASIVGRASVARVSAETAGEDFVPAPEESVPGGDGALSGDSAVVVEAGGVSCVSASSGGPEGDGSSAANAGPASVGAADTAAGCPSGQSLLDIFAVSESATSRETSDTGPFATTGDSFRIRYSATTAGVDPNAVGGLEVSVLDESGGPVGDFEADLSRTRVNDAGSLVVDAPAGAYRLRIVARAVQYDVAVAECGTSSPSSASASSGSPNSASPNAPASSGDPGRNVISSTIPNKTLADTGGPELSLVAAGLSLLAAGAAMVFFLSRRSG